MCHGLESHRALTLVDATVAEASPAYAQWSARADARLSVQAVGSGASKRAIRALPLVCG